MMRDHIALADYLLSSEQSVQLFTHHSHHSYAMNSPSSNNNDRSAAIFALSDGLHPPKTATTRPAHRARRGSSQTEWRGEGIATASRHRWSGRGRLAIQRIEFSSPRLLFQHQNEGGPDRCSTQHRCRGSVDQLRGFELSASCS